MRGCDLWPRCITQVDSLRFSLHHECETNANLQAARAQLEASLADVNRQLQELSQECSAMQLQHKKAMQKASHGEKALDKLGMELQHVRSEVHWEHTDYTGSTPHVEWMKWGLRSAGV